MRVVTPFRPFPPESVEHQALGPFDWLGAIDMLRTSVFHSNHCETYVLTDVDTRIDRGPSCSYRTSSRRLMLWILEVCRRYIQSADFTEDTVMVSPDALVLCDLQPYFAGDLSMVVRPDHPRPILNAVQWWPVRAKAALSDLYDRACDLAAFAPEAQKQWGADTAPFEYLLQPLYGGCGPRTFYASANLIDARQVLYSLRQADIDALASGEPVTRPDAVVDFRYLRKHHMRAYFTALFGEGLR